MSNKNQPGLTFSIPDIMDTIERKYDQEYELLIIGRQCWIDCPGGGASELHFRTLEKLHLWVAITRIELDELETEQSAANDKINYESANVDIFKQQF